MELGETIELQGLRKSYAGRPAVENVSLSIGDGEFFTLLGASGSGKTTTLMAIAGFTDLDEGDIRIGGRSVIGLPPEKRNLGVVFQNYALFPNMDVQTNIAFPLRMRGMPTSEQTARVKRILDLVGLGDFASRRVTQLSGGQQQRVALARALVFEPPVLLMDEPLGALDRQLREQLQTEIKALQRRIGVTVCYVTHDQDEALAMSDRIAVMANATLQDVGPPGKVYEYPKNLYVAKFLGESNVIPATRQGASIEPRGNTSAEAGSGLKILIRPENVKLSALTDAPSPESARIKLSGHVRSIDYLGSSARIYLDSPVGSLVARLPRSENPVGWQTGQELAIHWSKADERLYDGADSLID
jgi:putative spermidine/putrescine transport system ATP-binding protein